MYQHSFVCQVKSQNRPHVMLRLGDKACPKHLRYAEYFGILPADALNSVAV
jgi:hypothetical protein